MKMKYVPCVLHNLNISKKKNNVQILFGFLLLQINIHNICIFNGSINMVKYASFL